MIPTAVFWIVSKTQKAGNINKKHADVCTGLQPDGWRQIYKGSTPMRAQVCSLTVGDKL